MKSMVCSTLKNCYHKKQRLSIIISRCQNGQLGHFQGAAAVGYDCGTLLVLPKNETPRGRQTCGASVQSPPSAVAKALGAILAPTLTPCTAWLVRPALGAVHDFTPCSCPARPCWRRPLEREPAQVAPENAKSGDLGGGVATP